jgi:hypothetical protein
MNAATEMSDLMLEICERREAVDRLTPKPAFKVMRKHDYKNSNWVQLPTEMPDPAPLAALPLRFALVVGPKRWRDAKPIQCGLTDYSSLAESNGPRTLGLIRL